MQSINLKMATGAAMTIPFDGTLFVYESGVGVPGSGDYRIVVKPDNGNEIVLRPGQRFRTSRTNFWNIRPFDLTVGINGVVVIGNGEFDDAAIDQVVRLDGAYNNNVSVNNTDANRVPVSFDTTQTLKTTGAIVSYTNSYISGTIVPGAVKVIDAAVNVNGIIINRLKVAVSGTNAGQLSVLAKAGAVPAQYLDGDLLSSVPVVANTVAEMIQNLATDGQVRIPPGRSVYVFNSTAVIMYGVASILYTVL